MSAASASRRGRGRVGALLAGLSVATVALSGIGWAGGSAPAQAEEGEAVEETVEAAPLPTLLAAPATPVLSSGDEQFGFTALLQAAPEASLPAGTLTLWLGSERLESRESLENLLPQQEPLDSERLARLRVPQTEAGETRVLEAVVRRSEMPLAGIREAGVYLLHAQFVPAGLQAAQEHPVSTAVPVVWDGVNADPLPLTFIVPLVLPGEVSGVPDSAELSAVVPALSELLAAAEEHHATLAVDPRIVTGIRALGTAAPSAASELLARLESTSSRVFMLQFADADPAVQAALGFEELLQPLSFDYLTDGGSFEPDELPEQFEVAESDTAALTDGVPSLAELTSLPNAHPGAWPVAGEVDSTTLALLADAGLDELVLDSGNVDEAVGTRVLIGEFEALIVDAELSDAARASIGAQDATERDSVEQRAADAALAALTALDAQQGRGGAILALDRGTMADARDPLRIFDALDELPWVLPVGDRMQPEGTASLRAGGSGEDRRERLRTIVNRSTQIDANAQLLVEPDYLLEYQRARLLDAFATRFASAEVNFGEVAAAVRERDRELLNGVLPVTTESVHLVGASSLVPVTLHNWLPFDAHVQLRASPLSAAIAVPDRRFEVVVPAEAAENVLVPVHSRVSSGQSGLALEVRDVAGERVFAREVLPLELRAAVETILMVVLGGAAVLLLGFGIWRSVKRRRALRSGAVEQSPSAAE